MIRSLHLDVLRDGRILVVISREKGTKLTATTRDFHNWKDFLSWLEAETGNKGVIIKPLREVK